MSMMPTHMAMRSFSRDETVVEHKLAPGTLQANAATPLPPSPYQLSQGMVIETLSPVRAPIDEPSGQGDEATTEEME